MNRHVNRIWSRRDMLFKEPLTYKARLIENRSSSGMKCIRALIEYGYRIWICVSIVAWSTVRHSLDSVMYERYLHAVYRGRLAAYVNTFSIGYIFFATSVIQGVHKITPGFQRYVLVKGHALFK